MAKELITVKKDSTAVKPIVTAYLYTNEECAGKLVEREVLKDQEITKNIPNGLFYELGVYFEEDLRRLRY